MCGLLRISDGTEAVPPKVLPSRDIGITPSLVAMVVRLPSMAVLGRDRWMGRRASESRAEERGRFARNHRFTGPAAAVLGGESDGRSGNLSRRS